MPERKTMVEEMEEISARLRELSGLHYPHYRTFQRPDGTWVERQPTPEHMEEEELIRRFWELDAVRRAMEPHRNPLMISLHLQMLSDNLKGVKPPTDLEILMKIAQSVYSNRENSSY